MSSINQLITRRERMNKLCLIFLFFNVLSVIAFDISKSPFSTLKLNNDILGVHQSSIQHNLPPSIITSTWYLLMKKGSSDAGKIGNGCPDDSTICGITTTNSDSNDEKTIQLLSVSEQDISYNITTDRGIIANWYNIAYGDYKIDLSINFQCTDSDTEIIEWKDNTILIQDNINLIWKNKQFCSSTNPSHDNDNNDNSDNDNNDSNPSNNDGMGFFTMFFLIIIVVFAGYLVAQAWFNTSTMGSSGDFFNELTDTVVESFSNIPRLIIEVINKITGNTNSSRGGYSAV